MKIKRFTARDIAAATNMIKDEFGLAAIILSQREIPQEQGGGVEITAGVRDEDLPPTNNQLHMESDKLLKSKPRAGLAMGAAAYRKTEAAAEANDVAVKIELDSLGKNFNKGLNELKNLILDLAHRQSLSEKWRDRADLIKLYRRLLDTGLSAEHARNFVELGAESAKAWGGEVEEHLRKALKPKLRLSDLSISPPKRMAVVGPSGAGKTSTIVNLAAFYRQRGLKASAITLDTLRLGGAEQLTQYARILGFGVRICQNREEFKEALDIFESSDLVLIDTPSRSFQKSEGRSELGLYLDDAKASTLLVLPATMKEEDLSDALAKTDSWSEAGLVLTKFDETVTLGNIVGMAISYMPRLAFFSLGSRTSEDFIMATPDKLLDLWLKEAASAPL